MSHKSSRDHQKSSHIAVLALVIDGGKRAFSVPRKMGMLTTSIDFPYVITIYLLQVMLACTDVFIVGYVRKLSAGTAM